MNAPKKVAWIGFALILAAVLVALVLGLFIAPRWFGPFRVWHAQMQAGTAYMRSLKDSDVPHWIERTKRLLDERVPNVHPIGVYDSFGGKPIPPDLQRLKIIRIDIFEEKVLYVWMGGMDHTYLEVCRLSDGSFTFVAHYSDYQSEVIWPKTPDQAMQRTPKAFGVAHLLLVRLRHARR